MISAVAAARWAVVAWYGAVAAAVIYVDLVSAEKFGHGHNRLLQVVIGVASAWTSVAAVLRLAPGWYTALALTLFSCTEILVNWRSRIGPQQKTWARIVTLAFLLFNAALLALLWSPLGRGVFGA